MITFSKVRSLRRETIITLYTCRTHKRSCGVTQGGSDVVMLSTNDKNGNESNNDNNNAITSHRHHMQRNVDKLLSSIQDPFQLSMSDALLAATVLCADRRCRAVVDALNNQITDKLPSYIHLELECGTISGAAVNQPLYQPLNYHHCHRLQQQRGLPLFCSDLQAMREYKHQVHIPEQHL